MNSMLVRLLSQNKQRLLRPACKIYFVCCFVHTVAKMENSVEPKDSTKWIGICN